MALSPGEHSSASRGSWANSCSKIEEFLRHLTEDIVYTAGILFVLDLFWEAIRWLKFRGYAADKLAKLEDLHFVFIYLSVSAIGAAFVGKLVALLWKNR
jgi:hypothetical protein